MKRTILSILICAVLVSGCNKSKNVAATANDLKEPSASNTEAPNESALDKNENTEVATGEMRELLLTLQRVHFQFDSDSLTLAARDALDSAAKQMIDNLEVELWVDGHTDQRGSNAYNMALGEKRSAMVVDYLANLGVSAERLTIASFGEERPLEDGFSIETHAKNRRVDFRLLKGDIEFVLEEGTLVDDDGQVLDEVSSAEPKSVTNAQGEPTETPS